MTRPAISLTQTVTCLAFKPLLALVDETTALGAEVQAAIGPLPEISTLETHLPMERWLAAWTLLAEARPEIAVSIAAGERSSLADLEVFGFLAMTAESLGEAFARVGGVRALWASGLGWTLEESEGRVDIRLSPIGRGGRGAELGSEFLLAEMLQSMREIVGQHIVPIEVGFAHDGPVDEAPYTSFFGTGVHFGSEHNSLSFESTIAALPVKVFDSRLHAFFLRECEALVERAGSDDWLGRVRRWMAEAYADGPPTMKPLAKAMAMSERTLRRRLQDGGTSFKQMQEEVAVELANAYLRRPGLTASEVAFLLGFSEPSAFFRAYRRWTGDTPKAYQARRKG